MSFIKVWDRTSQFVSISVVFLKGSLSWRLSGMFPHPCHTTCPGRQWSQKSSSLQLHLPCKGCQKTWFSPVVKLPRNSELPAAGIQTAGAWLKAWRSSFLEDEAELFLPLSGVGFGMAARDHCVVCQMEEMELSGSPGFQDFWKGHVVTWYLKPISSKSASNELKRVCSMEEARILREATVWCSQRWEAAVSLAGFSSTAGYRLGHQVKALQLDSYLEGSKAISWLCFPLLNYWSVSWVPSGQNYLLSF